MKSLALIVAVLVMSSGCNAPVPPAQASDGPSLEITYEGAPLADVQVRLHDRSSPAIRAQALTGLDGKAFFPEVPVPEPESYRVSVESFSDGGWMLDPKLSQPQSSQLIAQPLMANANQRIELPKRSVQPLVTQATP